MHPKRTGRAELLHGWRDPEPAGVVATIKADLHRARDLRRRKRR